MKYNDYSKEEYRAVLTAPDEIIIKKELPDDYKEGGFKRRNTDIPCIDVPFDLDAISNIIVTPHGDFDNVKIGLKDCLLEQNLDKVRIYFSAIPVEK